jgi:hypothetical protein
VSDDGRYKALLIANWTYPKAFGPLHGPQTDIALLRDALCNSDRGVHSPTDLCTVDDKGSVAIRDELARFFAEGKPDDQLLVYYSGHGYNEGRKGELRLLARDSDHQHVGWLHSRTISLSFVRDLIEETRANAGVAPSTVHAFDCYHPPDKLKQRTPLPPPPLTPFRLHQHWRNDNDLNWTKYADVRVRVPGVTERVYLLPSGATPSAIHDPKHWGKNGKEQKRTITEAWCSLNKEKVSDGYLFDMKRPSGPLGPRMYCPAYDAFLRYVSTE